jgi:hypothetical protein
MREKEALHSTLIEHVINIMKSLRNKVAGISLDITHQISNLTDFQDPETKKRSHHDGPPLPPLQLLLH